MLKLYRSTPVIVLLISVVSVTSTACQRSSEPNSRTVATSPLASPLASPIASPVRSPASKLPDAEASAKGDAKTIKAKVPVTPGKGAPKVDPYQRAVERASSAYTLGKSAQSRDDWRLVVSRWQQAIELIKTVPASNPHHVQARQKLSQYQRNLTFAQQQSNRSTAAAHPDGVVVLPPGWLPPAPAPVVAPVAPIAAAPATRPPQSADRAFYAPIIRRAGNTPVIQVLFNNSQPFDMIVDTGASGTLITQQMASALGVVPVGQTTVDTASQRGVSFPLGYVQSIEVDGAVASNVLVAVAGVDLDVGLLGHDFFGDYDVTIREKEVEFRER